MKLLLDTHAIIWWATLDGKLSRKAGAAIKDSTNDVYVSAASAWEIAIKARLGKLDWPAEAGSVTEYVQEQGFLPLPIALTHAERAGGLEVAHRDPFDRMLIAQSIAEGLHLVTNEAFFDAFGVQRYW